MADKLPNHKLPVLASVRVAAPCKASWTEMAGDARSRFCSDCKTQVFDLSEMTRAQAERLIIERNGNLCARYYQRADGTVLTKNCEEGVHRRKRNAVAAYAGLAALFIGGGAIGAHEVATKGPDADQLKNLEIRGDADGVTIENTELQTEHYVDDHGDFDVDRYMRDKLKIEETHELILGKISVVDRDESLEQLKDKKQQLEKLKLERLDLEKQLETK